MKNLKIKILLIVLISLVFSAGCVQKETAKPGVSEPEATQVIETVECETLSGEEKDNCYLIIALNKKNIMLCEKIVDEKVKEECKAFLTALS